MSGSLKIIVSDITELQVDCIVNAANSGLTQGGGVCGAIFAKAGVPQLRQACQEYGCCPTGCAVLTPGFHLKAPWIVHAVGPVWQGGKEGERGQLHSCYQAALRIAGRRGCKTVAFPLISSGIYGYPRKEAWEVAISSILEFLDTDDHNLEVLIAVLDPEMEAEGTAILESLKRKDNK